MRWAGTSMIAAVMGLVCSLPADAHSCRHHCHANCILGCGDGRSGCGSHWNSMGRSEPFSRAPQDPAEGLQAVLQSREGKVTEVNYLPGATPGTAMVEIRLAAGPDPVLARLGPAGFLQNNQVSIREGDPILVTGYWVTGTDGEMLVVTQVTVRGRAVRLRDDRGRPVW